jgi:hypothetical protein
VPLADEVGGDAVEPRPGVRIRRVVAGAFAERDQERFRHQVVGDLGAEPPGEVALDMRRVAVEDGREPLGVVEGRGDDLRVVPGFVWTHEPPVCGGYAICTHLSAERAIRVHGEVSGGYLGLLV